MQSQFTDKARTALQYAERAARRMKHGYVGTEHILLGLVEEGSGTAARVLSENGADGQEIQEMIRDLIAPLTPVPIRERDGYTPRAVSILEEAHRQSEISMYRYVKYQEHAFLLLAKEAETYLEV